MVVCAGIYYACMMVLIMASPFLSGIVVNISHRGEFRKPPGRFVQAVSIIKVICNTIYQEKIIV